MLDNLKVPNIPPSDSNDDKNKSESEKIDRAKVEEIKKDINELKDVSKYVDSVSPETLQKALQEGIKESISRGYVPQDYLNLATEETINKIKEDQDSQDLIKKVIKKYISIEWDIPEEYPTIATEETLQKALQEGIKERISKGFSFFQYLNLLSQKNKQEFNELFENEIKIKDFAKQTVLNSFYRNKYSTLLHDIIDKEILPFKSKEYLKKALFDRTFVPLGLKFHTKEKKGVLDKYFQITGGFVAHQYKQCYITPPFANPYSLELFLLTTQKLLEKEKRPLGKDMYIQVCFPERMSNEFCGILTLAFLYARKNTLKFTEELLTHNQSQIGITIYDGGNFISNEHTIFDKNKKPHNFKITGRTDLLFCTSFDDIRLAQTIYTLLFHAAYKERDLIYKEIGTQFINEFKSLLKKHNKENWLNSKFVKLQFQDIPQLSNILLAITEEREKLNENILNYNQGVEYYKKEENPQIKKTLKFQLEEQLKTINSSLTMEIRSLIEKYYNYLITHSISEGEEEKE